MIKLLILYEKIIKPKEKEKEKDEIEVLKFVANKPWDKFLFHAKVKIAYSAFFPNAWWPFFKFHFYQPLFSFFFFPSLCSTDTLE